ncbi:MAG: hypothetical protein WCO06_00505 [Candidatus Roizmanbacteria bacterium]
MSLFNYFLRKRTNTEHYFGLLIKEQGATGFIYLYKEGKLEILYKRNCVYSNGWENIIEDVDNLLFELESQSKLRMKKVIYFTYSHLIDQTTHEIKDPYKLILKKLSKELELRPLGFIESYEAVLIALSEGHSNLLNTILFEIDKTEHTLFVIKAGKLLHRICVAHTQSLKDDLTEGLFKIANDVLLPPYIVFYGSNEIQEEIFSLKSVHWSKEIFIHQPKIEIVETDVLHKSMGLVFEKQLKEVENPMNKQEEQTTSEASYSHENSHNMIDFNSLSIQEENPTHTLLGFTVGGYAIEPEPYIKMVSKPVLPITHEHEIYEKPDNEPKVALEHTTAKKGRAFKFPPIIFKSRFVLISAIMTISVITFILISLFIFHKADIILILPTRDISETISFNIPVENSEDSQLLHIQISSISASFSDSKKTTGKHDVGEKAKGVVILRNKTNKEIQINKNSILKIDSLSYVLNDDVKIASSSENLSDGSMRPGEKKANVTATQIGSEYNLEKGKQISIADYSNSSIYAYNDTAFVGGTKRQIETVAKKDLEDLKLSVLNKGKIEVIKGLSGKTNDDGKIIDTMTNVGISNLKYSKEVGEEGTDVTLEANVIATYYSYNNILFKNKLYDSLKSEVPTGYVLNKNKISYDLVNEDLNKNQMQVKVDASAIVAKDLSKEELSNVIKGLSKSDAQTLIKSKYSIESVNIQISSPLSLFNGWIPFIQSKILIKFTDN